MAWKSIDKMATFDAFAPIPLIGSRPLLMVVGTRAATSWMSIDVFQRATGPKELHWINGASHNDLYDKPQYVDPPSKSSRASSPKASARRWLRQELPRSVAPS
jgi:hypothetical protein